VTLHSVTASSPEFFVKVLSAVYGPAAEEASEETEDTAAVRVRSVATQAFNLLGSWRKVPGLQKNGVVDRQELESWVQEARKRCADPGLAPIGDDHIGKTSQIPALKSAPVSNRRRASQRGENLPRATYRHESACATTLLSKFFKFACRIQQCRPRRP
jgi:hypothetical protein